MNPGEALAAFDRQLRNVVRPALFGGEFERAGRVLRCLSPTPDGWSGVEWADLDAATADAVIAEQVAYFAGHGRPFEWKYYAYDEPADLPDRLRAAGLEPGEPEALMVAAVADVPTDARVPDGVELRTVTDNADLDHVRRVHEEAFGGDHIPMVDALRERLRRAPDSVAIVLAVAGDEPVCAARADFHAGTDFASLWGGGTVAAWRGRGIYRATVAYRTRIAAGRGFSYLRTDALPTSEPILARLGFVRLTTTIPFTTPG